MIRFFDTVDHASGVDGRELFNREIVFLGDHVEDIEGDRDVQMVAVVAVVAADTVDFDVDLDLTEIVVQGIHEGLGSFPGDIVVDMANAKGDKEEEDVDHRQREGCRDPGDKHIEVAPAAKFFT